MLRSAPALGWTDVDLHETVGSRLKVPIFADSIPNSKNLTAHGFGSTKGLDDVVLLNVSLAVGCSLMLDGRLLRGTGIQRRVDRILRDSRRVER